MITQCSITLLCIIKKLKNNFINCLIKIVIINMSTKSKKTSNVSYVPSGIAGNIQYLASTPASSSRGLYNRFPRRLSKSKTPRHKTHWPRRVGRVHFGSCCRSSKGRNTICIIDCWKSDKFPCHDELYTRTTFEDFCKRDKLKTNFDELVICPKYYGIPFLDLYPWGNSAYKSDVHCPASLVVFMPDSFDCIGRIRATKEMNRLHCVKLDEKGKIVQFDRNQLHWSLHQLNTYRLGIPNAYLLIGLNCNGFWTLPGGKPEIGEPSRKTAIRETFEETRINTDIADIADRMKGPIMIGSNYAMHTLNLSSESNLQIFRRGQTFVFCIK